MSKISLTGNANGSGTFTIASPNSNSDRILNLPDSAGTLATAESTLAQFNASGSAPVYAARAWVNFNGTGTVAIRASGNVSSITDNGVGQYTLNFTTAMPDANSAVNVSGGLTEDNSAYALGTATAISTTSAVVRLCRSGTQSTLNDSTVVFVTIFR